MVGRDVSLLFAIVISVVVGCGGAGSEADREAVTVLAAASTVDAIAELVDAFQELHPATSVRVSTGPSNWLAQQINAGAPADVFLSANKQWAEEVRSAASTTESTDLLTNRLVLIVPQGNPAEVAEASDLTTNPVTRVALPGERVPAGEHAAQALRSLGLYQPLSEGKKLARGSDVRAALAYVERGEADAGLVYATDARASERVRVVAELDPQLHEPIIYELVLLSVRDPSTRRFYEFLQTDAALRVLAEHGFGTLRRF